MSLRPAALKYRSTRRARISVSPNAVVTPSTLSSGLFNANASANASSMSSPISVSITTSCGFASLPEVPLEDCARKAGVHAERASTKRTISDRRFFIPNTLTPWPRSAPVLYSVDGRFSPDMKHSSRTTRRRFLQQSALAAFASTLPLNSLFAASDPTPARAVKDKTPLHPGAFFSLPLGSVRPVGWLRRQQKIQARGLSGHLDETWADVGPNNGWLGGTGESWERGPYFLDGLIPLAYLLDDARLKSKAQKYIDWILTHQSTNGLFGLVSFFVCLLLF